MAKSETSSIYLGNKWSDGVPEDRDIICGDTTSARAGVTITNGDYSNF